MPVRELSAKPAPELQKALEEFEKQFSYPLGEHGRFRVSHTDDYTRFCRAMGDGRCFIYEKGGRVLGSQSVCLRILKRADGAETKAAYIFDTKTTDTSERGFALLRVSLASLTWSISRVQCAFTVVMDGTAVLPNQYTGRLGIPSFSPISKIAVIRISTSDLGRERTPETLQMDSETAIRKMLPALSKSAVICLPGEPTVRSSIAPIWLANSDKTACGCLEDTRLAKQLITMDGQEMKSAHLSAFGYASPQSGANLVRAALVIARDHEFPAMFVSTPYVDCQELLSELSDLPMTVASATIFGSNMKHSDRWLISTSEI